MEEEKVEKVIKIDESERDYVQFLLYEKEAYQNILSHILLEKSKGYEYSIDNYNHFMSEYKEAHMKYKITFDNLIVNYAPEYHGNNDYNATINFEECIMTITRINKGE